MILDGLLLFSSGTTYGTGTLAIGDAITATGNSTNTIDLGPGPTNTALPPSQTSPNTQPFRDIGIGDDPAMKLLVQCLTTFATGTSLTVGLQGAPDNGSGGVGAFTTWWSSPAVATASLTAGARLMDMDMPRPPAGVAEPRFLRLAYTVGGSNFTNATLLAAIVLDRMDQVYNATANSVMGGYPAGVTVAN
jgi:hypothetical protein